MRTAEHLCGTVPRQTGYATSICHVQLKPVRKNISILVVLTHPQWLMRSAEDLAQDSNDLQT